MNISTNQDSAIDDADRVEPGYDACPPRVAEAAPSVRCREEHGISRRDIDQDALKVLYRLSRNNYTVYLVGGGVRDLLLGRKPKDFDISTNAKPEEIRALFRNCILIGRRFRLAHIRYGDKIIETSTFRTTPQMTADPADPDTDLFQRDDNIFGTPQEDALRRDFTINGLFYDIDSFSVIDYVGGLEDLEARRIRSIGDPCIRFREDPVRMVRAVRFASRLNFDFDPETLDAVRKHRDELAKAAPARLLEEIARLFAFSAGEKAVGLLHATGLMQVVLPEIAACLDDPGIDTSLFWPRLRALDAGDTVLPDATPALIFSVILSDPLFTHMRKDWRGGGAPRLKFDKIRSFLEPIALRLRFPRKLTDRIVHIFMSQHRFANPGGKKNSIAGFVTQEWFHEALALAEINHTAQGKSQADLNIWRDMLAERMYGRDEPATSQNRERRREHNKPGLEAPQPVADESGENGDLPGKKLSRSARRRNKKRNRKLRQDAEHSDVSSADAVQEESTPDLVAAVEPPEAPEPTEQPAAEPAKPTRRNRRGKGKPAVIREEQEPQEQKPAAEPETAPAAKTATQRRGGRRQAKPAQPEVSTEPEKPLTAAVFYQPENGNGSGKSEKQTSARKGKKNGKSPSESAKLAQREGDRSDKPLSMDKADEADIPMHWLDEI